MPQPNAVLSRVPTDAPAASPSKSRIGIHHQKPFRRQDNYRTRNTSFSENGRQTAQFSQMNNNNNNNNSGYHKFRPEERQQTKSSLCSEESGFKKGRATSESEPGNPKKKINVVGKTSRVS